MANYSIVDNEILNGNRRDVLGFVGYIDGAVLANDGYPDNAIDGDFNRVVEGYVALINTDAADALKQDKEFNDFMAAHGYLGWENETFMSGDYNVMYTMYGGICDYDAIA